MREEILLQQAARLRALITIGRARGSSRRFINQLPETSMQQKHYPEPVPDAAVRTITAELLERVTLDDSGTPFDDDNPETWAAADGAIVEIVSRGPVRFRVVDSDPTDLAVAAGAIEAGESTLCLRVEFDSLTGAPAPAIGQLVAVATEVPGVTLAFGIWATHADLHASDAPVFGLEAVCNEAFDVLKFNQALLVQVNPGMTRRGN